MPEEVFSEFLEEIGQRRKQAFSKKRSGEVSVG